MLYFVVVVFAGVIFRYVLGNHHLHGVLRMEEVLVEHRAYKKLKDSLDAYNNNSELFGRTIFEDIIKSIVVPESFVHLSNGKGEHEKYFVGVNAIKQLGKSYVVYGFGIDNHPEFEVYMSKLNASVFAFDCTNVGKPEWEEYFTFKPWCVGQRKEVDNAYTKNSINKNFTFMPLAEIKKVLGHNKIDMLKMDIEGFEWEILENDIVKGKSEDLPMQLLFELHGEGANAYWVPPANVKGKGRRRITQLFMDLYIRHYRVANVEFGGNGKDKHCAEISLIRVATD